MQERRRNFYSCTGFGCMQLWRCQKRIARPGCVSHGLKPQQARITDERILSDRRSIDAVQLRLRKLNEAGIPQNSYLLARAQCWLAAVTTVSSPAATTAPPVISRETCVLMTDTLIKFDKSGSEDMIPGGLQRLADVAQRMKAYKSI